MNTGKLKRTAASCDGFSLIELLVVITIIALLTGFAVFSLGAVNSNRLQVSAQTVIGELDIARQRAVTRNAKQEVRLWKLPGQTGGAEVYRGIQIFEVRADGTVNPAGRAKLLETGIRIEEDPALSNLFAQTTQSAPYPGQGNKTYIALRFHPDGSTDLAFNQRWFLTLQRAAGAGGATPEANRFTIEVEPVLGTVRSFRP